MKSVTTLVVGDCTLGIISVTVLPANTVRLVWDIEQGDKIGYFLLFSAIFRWRAIGSQYYILMSGFTGFIYSWLAITRQEKIASVIGLNGYDSKN